MIWIEFLFALTVPSDPRPKKTAFRRSAGSMSIVASHGSEVCVTSSTIPIVNWRFGDAFAISAKTETTIAGVNSLEDRPYRPATTRGSDANAEAPVARASASAATTSSQSGSPGAPGSFVRSRTAIVFTVFGRAATKCARDHGRYRRTLRTPTFSPFAFSHFAVSSHVSAPEPITTITRSASFAPA